MLDQQLKTLTVLTENPNFGCWLILMDQLKLEHLVPTAWVIFLAPIQYKAMLTKDRILKEKEK